MDRLIQSGDVRERSMLYGRRTLLVGVLTHAAPGDPQAPRPCMVILNAGIVRKIGPGRLNVILARRLAALGFDAFRFDFAGVGDSPIRGDGHTLADGVVMDVAETLDHLESVVGHKRFVLIGLCSGADNGMRAAEVDRRVVGLVMLDPTIDRTLRWHWEKLARRLKSASFWKSIFLLRHPIYKRMLALLYRDEPDAPVNQKPELYQIAYNSRDDIEKCLRELIDRGVELLVNFTGSWSFIYNYETQFYDVYPKVPFGNKLTLLYQPEADHLYEDSMERKRLLDNIAAWCQRFL